MRYLVDDIQGKDSRSLLTVAVMSMFIQGIKAPKSQYIEYVSPTSVKIVKDTMIDVNGKSIFRLTDDLVLTTSNLDTGTAFTVGKDYYIYIVGDEDVKTEETYKISLNSTFPQGANANNSRKIGGFHYGRVRKINPVTLNPQNATNADWGTGWEDQVTDGILPYSIWTLHHRSSGVQEGMTYIPSLNIWVSIYLLSLSGNTFVSRHNVLPVSGADGYTAFDAIEKLKSSKMRCPTVGEFIVFAEGSPVGRDNDNNYAYTASTNTGKTKTGSVSKAVSIYGCVDCVGNLWECTTDVVLRYDGRLPIQAPSGGKGGFNVYKYFPFNFINVGGGWFEGSNLSSRAIFGDINPWIPNSEIGFRGVCDHISHR